MLRSVLLYDPWIGKFPWRRKWQPTPGILPGQPHGERSLVGCSPWGPKESDTISTCMLCSALLYLRHWIIIGGWFTHRIDNHMAGQWLCNWKPYLRFLLITCTNFLLTIITTILITMIYGGCIKWLFLLTLIKDKGTFSYSTQTFPTVAPNTTP